MMWLLNTVEGGVLLHSNVPGDEKPPAGQSALGHMHIP